jgi:AAHS family 4-hydroxybenzoate transporter-like MFS transporter
MWRRLTSLLCQDISPERKSADDRKSISEVVDKLGIGLAQLRVLIAGGVWMADGAELLLITAAADAVAKEWHLNDMMKGSMITVVFFGVLVGNFLGGSLGDVFGRRLPILVSFAGIFVFSIGSSYTTSFVTLSVARLLVGFAFGVGQPAETALVAEGTPTQWRITGMATTFMLFSLGETFSGWLISVDDPTMLHLDWRWLMRAGAIPPLIIGLMTYMFTYESPYYLSVAGKHEEAMEVLKQMRSANGVDPSLVSVECIPAKIVAPGVGNQLSTVFGRELRCTTLIMSYTTFVVNLVFYGSLYAFTQILPDLAAHSDPGASPASALILGALMELPGYTIGMVLGSLMSRKACVVLYLVLSVSSLMAFAMAIKSPEQGPQQLAMFAMHYGYYGIKVWTSVGFVVVYLMDAEIYPSSARATGTAVCLVGGRVGAMLAPFAYAFVMDRTGNSQTFFVVLAISCVVNLLLIPFLTDTTGSAMDKKDVEAIAPSGEVEKGRSYGAVH